MKIRDEMDKVMTKIKGSGADGFLGFLIKDGGCAICCHEMDRDDLLSALVILTEAYKENHKDIYDKFIKLQAENPERIEIAFAKSKIKEAESKSDDDTEDLKEELKIAVKAMADLFKKIKEND